MTILGRSLVIVGALGLLACASPSTGTDPVDMPTSVDPTPSVPATDAPNTPTPPPRATALYVLHETALPSIERLNVSTGHSQQTFEATRWSYVYEFSLDRERATVVMAHTTAPEYGEEPYDRAGLYEIPLDGATEARDIGGCPDAQAVFCFYPVVQGDRAWFVQTGAGVEAGSVLTVTDRVDQTATALIENATEPTVSPDGRRLAWIAVDPEDGRRSLELGDADGQWTRTLIETDDAYDIGQPFFAADGQSVFFVRLPAPSESVLAWLGGLLVSTAHAHDNHNTPGDWWRVAIGGGAPAQITTLRTIHYDGRADPGGDWIFIATREGVLQVDLQTGEVVRLQQTRTARALDWWSDSDL